MRIPGFVVAFVGALLLGQPISKANFVYTTSRVPITSGTFAGDDGVTLFIKNDGTNGTGSDLLYYDVSMSSGTANPRFFIRSWNGTIHSKVAANNTLADFGGQGFLQGDATRDGQVNLADLNIVAVHFNNTSATWSTGDLNGDGLVNLADLNLVATSFNSSLTNGSYVRFGTNAQFDSFFPLGPTPAENSQVYTDGQSVTGFELATLQVSQASAGLPDSVATQLAFAVVPTGQGVTFSGSVGASVGPSNPIPFTITDAGSGLSAGFAALTAVPEPASIGLLSVGALVLCRTRRANRGA